MEKKQSWKPGNMLYPVPAVMVSCGDKEGNKNMRELLGGKGANLCEMANMNLPVPQGFIVTTEACNNYYDNNEVLSDVVVNQIYEKLEDFSSVANSRFELWKGRQIKRGIQFTEEQQQWLEEIKNYIVANAYMELKDIHEAMQHKGGIIKARQVFGQELQPILDDLSVALVG